MYSWVDELGVATKAAAAGGLAAQGLADSQQTVFYQAHDLKLPSDEVVEKSVRETIMGAFPKADFLGEELGGTVYPHRLTWIIDPVDGTVNYSRKLPWWCCSVALFDGQQVQVAAIDSPAFGLRLSCRSGHLPTLNGVRLSKLAEGTLDLASVHMALGSSARAASLLSELAPQVQKIRILGSMALDLCLVALGRADAFFAEEAHFWDIAAGILICQEAGCVVRIHERHDGRIRVLASRPGVDAPLARILGWGD